MYLPTFQRAVPKNFRIVASKKSSRSTSHLIPYTERRLSTKTKRMQNSRQKSLHRNTQRRARAKSYSTRDSKCWRRIRNAHWSHHQYRRATPIEIALSTHKTSPLLLQPIDFVAKGAQFQARPLRQPPKSLLDMDLHQFQTQKLRDDPEVQHCERRSLWQCSCPKTRIRFDGFHDRKRW